MASFAARTWRLSHLRPLLRRRLSGLGEPQLDWAFLLDPANTPAIRENCRRRRAAADIDHVLELHWRHSEAPSAETQQRLQAAALRLPNFSHADAPVGSQPRQLASRLYTAALAPTDAPADLVGKRLAQLRLGFTSLGAEPRAYYLVGGLALLERALVRLALARLQEKGFRRVCVPDAIPAQLVERCGFPTRGPRTQVYHVAAPGGLCLAGTAEMALAGCVAGRRFADEELPLRLCAVSRCYRREAPHQEEMLYRVHQFTKVEMFAVSGRRQSARLLQELVDVQTGILDDLGLRYRVLEMPTEELGLPAHRKIDVEAYMRHSRRFGEVCSASDCTDFQARRLLIRHGDQFAATLNATAVAVPRLVKAILEEKQNRNHGVDVPEVLWPWMDGVRTLRRQHPPVGMKFFENPWHLP